MSRRRKPTPESLYIWGELEQVFQAYSGSPEERDRPGARARWQKLWDEYAAGGKLGTIPIEAAGRLLQWGWRFAMEDRRYDAATELMSAYFAHPKLEQDNVHTRIVHRCDMATSILFSGDEAAGVAMFSPLLESERKSEVRCALVKIRGDLDYYLSERAGDMPASPALADLVEEIVNRFRRRVPRKRRPPTSATCADLMRLLDSTSPPSGREATRKKTLPQRLSVSEQLERVYRAFCAAHSDEKGWPDARAQWEKLWEETGAGDKLGTVDVNDAGQITCLGWHLEMASGNYSAAAEILSSYFAHPNIEKADPTTKTHRAAFLQPESSTLATQKGPWRSISLSSRARTVERPESPGWSSEARSAITAQSRPAAAARPRPCAISLRSWSTT